MPRVIRLIAALTVALSIAGSAAPAAAHPVPFSYLDLRLQSAAIEGSLVLHILDVGHDLNLPAADRLLDPAFAAQQAEAIARLLKAGWSSASAAPRCGRSGPVSRRCPTASP